MSAKRRTARPIAVTNPQPGESIKFSKMSAWGDVTSIMSFNAVSILDIMIKSLELEEEDLGFRYMHSKPVVHCIDEKENIYSATIVLKDYRNRMIWNMSLVERPIDPTPTKGAVNVIWDYPSKHLPTIAVLGVAKHFSERKSWDMTSNPVFCSNMYYGTDGGNKIIVSNQQQVEALELYIVDGERVFHIAVSTSPFVDNPLV